MSQQYCREKVYERMTETELADTFSRLERKKREYAISYVSADYLANETSMFERLGITSTRVSQEHVDHWAEKLDQLEKEYALARKESEKESRAVRASSYRFDGDSTSAIESMRKEVREYREHGRRYLKSFAHIS
ncbi:hypothetical protein [Candidatus Nanohalococcus occultus]|uniref:hypothetical protein n=1 Tax=Candidatus Nanohalococcus occultus TaxID=2978047 RepID=UPI0039E07BAA